MSDVTQLLEAIDAGDPKAPMQLLPLVYDELRRLAAARLARERCDHTLNATALVHEAYVRLVDQSSPPMFQNRRHFFGAAAEAMRRILVESARRKRSQKKGGGLARTDLDPEKIAAPERSDDLIALDEALTRFSESDPEAAELVKLRYFAGLPLEEAADLLGISKRTAERLWAFARAWLHREIYSDE